MLNKLQGSLKRSFAAALAFTAVSGGAQMFYPADAEASVVIIAAAASSSARHRHDREAMDNLIANPSAENVQIIRERLLITAAQVPYVLDSIKEMNVPKNIVPEGVTEEMRSQLKSLILQNQTRAIIASSTPEEAVQKGLETELAPYFNFCKQSKHAVSVMQCMEDQHWEKDTKPLLKTIGGVLGGGLLSVGASVAFIRRRRY